VTDRQAADPRNREADSMARVKSRTGRGRSFNSRTVSSLQRQPLKQFSALSASAGGFALFFRADKY
jgi:hypothetical protein